jgi:hypothetical protein
MNKAEIRTQVQALLTRNDVTNDLLDTFIDQAVSRIQRTLRIPAMEKAVTYTVTDITPETLLIPNDFLSIKHLYIDGYLLEYLDVGRFIQMSYGATTGTPRFYTRLQGQFQITPTPVKDSTVTLVYYGEIPDLVTDTDMNFLTEIAPDLLIYGALTFAAVYYIDERKPGFEAEFTRIYGEVEEQARIAEMEQSAMRIAPAYDVDY